MLGRPGRGARGRAEAELGACPRETCRRRGPRPAVGRRGRGPMAARSPVRVAAAAASAVGSAGLRLRARLLCRGGFPGRERRLEVSRSLLDFVTSRAEEMVHRDALDPCG